MRRQMESHPAVYDYAYQNVQLKAEVDQLKKLVQDQTNLDPAKRQAKISLLDQLSSQLATVISENEELRQGTKRDSIGSVSVSTAAPVTVDVGCNTEMEPFSTPTRAVASPRPISPLSTVNESPRRGEEIAFWQAKLERAERAMKEEEEAHAKTLAELQSGLVTSKQYASTVESELTG